MEEQQNYPFPETPQRPFFPTGKREFIFLLLILLIALLIPKPKKNRRP